MEPGDQDRQPATEAAIAESRDRLSTAHMFQVAVERTRMPMAFADPTLHDCPLVYVNDAFVQETGYSVEEAVGRNCRFLQGADTDESTVQRIREAIIAERPFSGEIYNYRRDGSGFWNNLFISPVHDASGKLTYYFASQVDITDHKDAARRQAQRLESMGALASGVAHEFNNLMTIVIGSVERAIRRASDDRQTAYLQHAEAAARRAGQLAGELLSLARRQSVSEQAVEINSLIRTNEAVLAQIVPPNVHISLNLAPGAFQVRLDFGQLELVLLHLVRNAAEAMPEGGALVIGSRTLDAAEATAALGLRAAAEISVADTGRGMSRDVMDRASELFYSTKQPGLNTGLGLFLALEFVEQSGGRLSIDSTLGHGTIVRMLFPLEREHRPPSA